MAQETNQSQAPLVCTTGCGFYGNPRNNGMCSMCYKDFLQRQNSSGRVSPPESSTTVSSIGESLLAQCSETSTVPVTTATSHKETTSEPNSDVSALATITKEESTSEAKVSVKTEELQTSVPEVSAQVAVETEDKPKAKKNRCLTCRKKVGLTGFDCRCGNVFCGVHRYSDMHNCTFDYKADAAEKIRKENPVIVGEKIQKI